MSVFCDIDRRRLSFGENKNDFALFTPPQFVLYYLETHGSADPVRHVAGRREDFLYTW